MLPVLRISCLSGPCYILLFWSISQGGLLGAPNHDASKRGEIAKPYAVQRYAKLWTAQLFYQTAQPENIAAEPPTPTPTAVCNYVLDGIAEVGGKQYIYLREKSTGALHELQLKQAVGNLEVTKVSLGDQPAYHKVSIRSGNDTFLLQFDLSAPQIVQAPPRAGGKPEAVRNPAEKEIIAVDPRDALESRRRSLREADDWIDEPEVGESGR